MSEPRFITAAENLSIETVQVITTRLTDDQIKNLPSSGIDVVPAPGAGHYINFIHATVLVDTTEAAYGNLINTSTDAGVAFSIGSFDVSNYSGQFTTSLFQQTTLNPYSKTVWFATPQVQVNATTNYTENSVVASVADLRDQPIQVYVNSSNGNFDGGDISNYMDVTVYYKILDIT